MGPARPVPWLVVLALFLNYPHQDRSGHYGERVRSEAFLKRLPENAVLYGTAPILPVTISERSKDSAPTWSYAGWTVGLREDIWKETRGAAIPCSLSTTRMRTRIWRLRNLTPDTARRTVYPLYSEEVVPGAEERWSVDASSSRRGFSPSASQATRVIEVFGVRCSPESTPGPKRSRRKARMTPP